jgi:hypothetical protein
MIPVDQFMILVTMVFMFYFQKKKGNEEWIIQDW